VADAPLILVVEDDYPLQGVVEDFLRQGGFETHILSSGEEALTLFRDKVAEYKALVTDVNLKGTLNGWEVARQIRETAADPVVYMTRRRCRNPTEPSSVDRLRSPTTFRSDGRLRSPTRGRSGPEARDLYRRS
jgi:hypothetical protein